MAQNDYVIGIGMGLDVSGLKSGLEQAKTDIALAASEFEAQAGWSKAWKDSIDGVTAKIDQMGKELDAKKQMVELWQQELDRVTDIYGEDSAEAKKTETQLNKAQAAYNKAEGYVNDLKARLKELEEQEENTGDATDDLAEDIEDMGDEADDTQKGGLKKLKDSLIDIKESVADKVKSGLANIKEKFADLASKGIGKAVDMLKDFIRGVINVGKDFTSTMSMVRANSGASAAEMEELEKVAKEMGASTTFSAVESAEALNYMALAGWDAKQSAEALGGILDLAAAAQMDLGDASDMVTDYLGAFGLEAKDAGHFADVLAYAQSHANTTAAGLGEAYENVAATMGTAGQSVETTTALLMAMANQGTKGSRAGTALNAVMRDLTKKMKDGQVMIGDTAVAVSDEEGNFRDLITILYDAKKAVQGMGTAEAQSALMTTFTSDSVKAVNEIFTEGVVAVGQYRNELKKSDGAAKSISDIMNDNLSGDMKMLDSAVQDIQIGIFELIEGPLRTIVQLTTEAIKGIKWLAETIYNALVALYNVSIKPFIDAFGESWNNITSLFDGAGDFFGGVSDDITAAWDGLTGWFGEQGEDQWSCITDAWDNAGTYFGEVWDNITGAFDNAKQELSDVASNMRSGLESGWNGLTQWAGGLWTDIKGAFSNAKADFEGFASKMREGLQFGWGEIANWFGDRWTDIKGAFGGAKDALTAVASNMRSGLESGWTNLTTWAGGLWNTIKGAFSSPLETFKGIAGSIRDGLQSGWDTLAGENGFFTGIWNKIKGAFPNVGDWFSKTFGGAIEAITKPFQGIANWFRDNVVGPIKRAFGPLLRFFGLGGDDDDTDPYAEQRAEVDRLKSAYESANSESSTAYGVWQDMVRNYGYGSSTERAAYNAYINKNNASSMAYNAWKAAEAGLKELEEKAKSEASSGLGGITNAITKPFSDALSGIKEMFGGIGTWFSDNVTGPISGALGGVIGVGGDIIGGLAEGITSAAGGVIDAIGDVCGGIWDTCTGFFRVGSPSKLMRDEMGQMIGEGMAEGIRDSIGTVERASEELSEAAHAGGSMSEGGPGGGSVVFNQVINSPDPLSAGQIYRDTRSLLGRRGWSA